MTVVELIRHAHAGKRGDWSGADRRRPLDGRGRQQAQQLAVDLDDGLPVAAIVSSPFTRCVMTVEPLAERLRMSVETDVTLEELDEVPITEGGTAWVNAAWLGGRALDLLERRVPGADDRRLILCSHGDVIPALLATLVGRDSLPLRDVRCPKAGRYRMHFEGSRCVAADAVRPPDTESGPAMRPHP